MNETFLNETFLSVVFQYAPKESNFLIIHDTNEILRGLFNFTSSKTYFSTRCILRTMVSAFKCSVHQTISRFCVCDGARWRGKKRKKMMTFEMNETHHGHCIKCRWFSFYFCDLFFVVVVALHSLYHMKVLQSVMHSITHKSGEVVLDMVRVLARVTK